LEGSQEVLNLSNKLAEIEKHFEKEYPREGCGVLGIVQGKLEWFPCNNVAEDDEDFVLDSKQYLDIRKKADIVGIVHSHPDASCEPSISDINNCNALLIPYYIFSYPEMKMHVQEPKYKKTDLIGREYIFGHKDCFEAARDWYLEQGTEIPPRMAYENEFWEKDIDYFCEEHINTWGFKKVEEPKIGDFLVFSVDSKVNNHCGIFLGNDVFFHHAANRLSCRENLYPFWIKYLKEIYRYET